MSATFPAGRNGRGEQPGRIMSGEMAEQPGMLRRILDRGDGIREVAAEIAARKPRFVLLTARGTSDNAALYAKYLLEIRLGLPCGLTSMSTTTAYGARPDLTDVLVITISQSGGSPDLMASTKAAPGGGGAHPRRHQQPGLRAGRGLRVPHRHPRGPGEGPPGHEDVHRLPAVPLSLRGGSVRR
ncbi:hypothetical protein ACVWXU_003470 [Streptomyces sp. TE33382]